MVPGRTAAGALAGAATATSRFAIQSDFSLLVENVTEEDGGVYECNVQSDPPLATRYNVQIEGTLYFDDHFQQGVRNLVLGCTRNLIPMEF